MAVLPLPTGQDAGADTVAGSGGIATARSAKADDCKDPEASLRPGLPDGAAIQKIKARGKLIAGVDQNSFRWGYRNPVDGKLDARAPSHR